MKKNLLLILSVSILIIGVITLQSCRRYTVTHIGFYNVENLFDTKDNPDKIDEQFLPEGDYRWDDKKYQSKLEKLSEVISKMCGDVAPDVLGLCEVENKAVLKDLVKQSNISDQKYKIVHFESPDARGIDVALLYNDKYKVKKKNKIHVDLSGFGDNTRDILHVELKNKIVDQNIHVFVNHWPSRREGKAASEPKRVQVAKTLLKEKAMILKDDPDAHIFFMGDFNDEPFDKSIKEVLSSTSEKKQLETKSMFNPMERLKQAGLGSYNFRGNWNMLDQIMMTPNLLDGKNLEYVETSASIFSPEWLRQHGGKYEGYPLRTFGGRKYLDGYSDHFPVSIALHFRY